MTILNDLKLQSAVRALLHRMKECIGNTIDG